MIIGLLAQVAPATPLPAKFWPGGTHDPWFKFRAGEKVFWLSPYGISYVPCVVLRRDRVGVHLRHLNNYQVRATEGGREVIWWFEEWQLTRGGKKR